MSGDLFENCTHRYSSIERTFTNCTNTTDQCDLIKDLAAALDVTKWLNFYVSTFIFVVSCLINTYTLATGIYTYSRLENESRKHYVFVLSRTVSSILIVVSLLLVESVLFSSHSPKSFALFAVVLSFYNFSLNSLLISFICVSLLTYIGVVHPMFYRRKLSLRVLYWSVSLMYLFSLIISIPISLYQAASNTPGPISCNASCLGVVAWITFGLSFTVLSLTVLLYGFVVVSLHWHHHKAKKNGIESSEVMDRARLRLTWTFVGLVLFYLVELFPAALAIGYDKNDVSSCKSFYRASEILVQAAVQSTVVFIGSIIFLTDPILTIFFDKNISKTVKRQECVNTTDQCQLIQDISTAYSILTWFGFYASSCVCLLAVLVDTYCLFVTICILQKLEEETRKRYVSVIIRLSSSIIIATCIVLIQLTTFTDVSFVNSFAFYAVVFVMYDFSIFSLLGSFMGIAVSTYFGVMRPMVYRQKFTLRAMYLMAAAIWTVSACVALEVPLGLFQAADAVDGPIRCDSPTCKLVVKWLVFSLSCTILLATLSTLIFVTISLYWHSHKQKKIGSLVRSASSHGKVRLAWTTGILVTFCLVELVPTGVLIGFREYGFLSSCDNFYRANHLIIPAVVTSFETFFGSIAFLLDPIINFFFDRHISKEVSSQIKTVRDVFTRRLRNDITPITASSSP